MKKQNKLKQAVIAAMLGTSLLLTGCGGGGGSVAPADTDHEDQFVPEMLIAPQGQPFNLASNSGSNVDHEVLDHEGFSQALETDEFAVNHIVSHWTQEDGLIDVRHTHETIANPSFTGLELDAEITYGSVDMDAATNGAISVFGISLTDIGPLSAPTRTESIELVRANVADTSERTFYINGMKAKIGDPTIEADLEFEHKFSFGARAKEARALIIQNMLDANAPDVWVTHEVTGAGINVKMTGFATGDTGALNFDEYTTLMTAAGIAPNATFGNKYMADSDINIINGNDGVGTTLEFNRSGSAMKDFDNTLFDVGTAAGIGALVMERFPYATNTQVNGNVERSEGSALKAISPSLFR